MNAFSKAMLKAVFIAAVITLIVSAFISPLARYLVLEGLALALWAVRLDNKAIRNP